jgi:hypothetical protein
MISPCTAEQGAQGAMVGAHPMAMTDSKLLVMGTGNLAANQKIFTLFMTVVLNGFLEMV